MNRRGLIQAALAALASIPCWLTPSAANTHTLADIRKVQAARDLLLPALRWVDSQTPDVDLDIQVDYETASLLVIGRNPMSSPWRELGFAITRNSILYGCYKAEFGPSLASLVRLLTNTTAAEYDRIFGPEGYAR
jgi:hypothetical protein